MPWNAATRFNLYTLFGVDLTNAEFGTELDARMAAVEAAQGQTAIDYIEGLITQYQSLKTSISQISNSSGIKKERIDQEFEIEYQSNVSESKASSHGDLSALCKQIKTLLGLGQWFAQNTSCCGLLVSNRC
jgi:hypothetical protein